MSLRCRHHPLLRAAAILLLASGPLWSATQCAVCQQKLGDQFFWMTSPVLAERFTGWGYNVTQHTFNSQYAPNIIAERPGTTRPQDVYILDAHFDSAGVPGCDDNGSGTAAVLIAARILSQYTFEGTVRFVGFSAEEYGLVGSDARPRLTARPRNSGSHLPDQRWRSSAVSRREVPRS